MTISIETLRTQYIGNGATVEYAWVFRVDSDADLVVSIDGVTQTLDVDYTIENNGDETGGAVTFMTAPALDSIITLRREVTPTQEVDLIPYDRFPAQAVEEALDRVVMLVQQNADLIARALVAGDGFTAGTFSFDLPALAAGEFWKYASDGESIETAKIQDISPSIVASATDAEITAGTETEDRLVSPKQLKDAVTQHETAPISDINNVQWVSVVASLPGTPDANTLYLVTT